MPNGSRFEIEVAGAVMEAAWWGPAANAAPTIVLLHEGLGCIALWRDVPARLAEATGCGVLAYSRAGYGASSPVMLPRPLNYMHDEAEHVLGPVLDQTGIRQAILLGHSDGGSIAAIYVGSRNDRRVVGMILIAAHFFVEEITLASIETSKTTYQTTNLREKLRRYHQDPDNAFWGWNGAWLDPEFAHWRIDQFIPEIRVPVLLIQGSADEYGTLAQFERFQNAASCALDTVIVDQAGHSPHLSHPDTTLAKIERFIARLLREPPWQKMAI